MTSHIEGGHVEFYNHRTGERKRFPFHSFLEQYYNLLYELVSGSTVTITDTSGVAQPGGNTGRSSTMMQFNAGSTDNTHGIQLGTGTAANTSATYALSALIANGVGAGNLVYGASSTSAPAFAAPNFQMVMTRTFTNGSGGDITVNEIALVANYVSTYEFMITRDVISGGFLIPSGDTVTATVTMSYAIA